MRCLSAVLTLAGVLIPVRPATADHFLVSVATVDGEHTEGIVHEKDARFEAVMLDGKSVRLRLEKNAPYVKREVSETITRLDIGFLLQAPSYAAVVKTIWAELPVRVGDEVVKVAGKDVRRAIVKPISQAFPPQRRGQKPGQTTAPT